MTLLDTADELMTLCWQVPHRAGTRATGEPGLYLAEQGSAAERTARRQRAGKCPQGREGGCRAAEGQGPQERA